MNKETLNIYKGDFWVVVVETEKDDEILGVIKLEITIPLGPKDKMESMTEEEVLQLIVRLKEKNLEKDEEIITQIIEDEPTSFQDENEGQSTTYKNND